jgi:polygalacturonase
MLSNSISCVLSLLRGRGVLDYPVLVRIFLLAMLHLGFSNLHAQHYNVKDYGIEGTNPQNTQLINGLIDQVFEQGGGTIVFPAGEYLTGAIHLKSNIHLVVEGGAVLKFSQNFDDYPFVQTRWAGVECIGFSPLIYANGAENVSITGMGTIDGNAFAWYDRQLEIIADRENVKPETKWEKELAELNKNADPGDLVENYGVYWKSQFLRPPVIQFYNCTNVLLRDITVINSPFWTIHPVYCDRVTIDNVTIDNPPGTHNTDGINPESSRNVHISNCLINVDDDCITLKAGRDSDGRRVGIPTENVTITNCIFNRGYGGLTIGSEMSGGVKNVVVSNCVFNDLDWGIRIKTQRGRGGIIENIQMNNLIINNNKLGISINTRYTELPSAPVSERTPIVRNIRISDVMVNNAQRAGQIIGLEEMPVEDVFLENIVVSAEEGFRVEDAKGIWFGNVHAKIEKGKLINKKNARVKTYRITQR